MTSVLRSFHLLSGNAVHSDILHAAEASKPVSATKKFNI